MKKEVLYTVPSYFRDDMKILSYRFGKGEKSCVILGALRGDEVQQLYVCARLVSFLRDVEKEGGFMAGRTVTVIPSAIPASMNVGTRLWAPENMDINRCFPGDANGSTTERIADSLFSTLKLYRYGIQLTSFYQPGSFVPHVRVMDTGKQNPELGCEFGLPYVYVRKPRITDRTTLNYAWQFSGTQAYLPVRGQDARDRRDRGGADAARHHPLPQHPRHHPQREFAGAYRQRNHGGRPDAGFRRYGGAAAPGEVRWRARAARRTARLPAEPDGRLRAGGAEDARHRRPLLRAGGAVYHAVQPGLPGADGEISLNG